MVDQTHFRVVPQNDPDTVHFVLLDHGRHGQAFRETLPVTTDGDLVRLIEGECQIDAPIVRILAVNAKLGTAADVTAQIGSLVFYAADSEGAGFDHFNDAMRDLCAKAGYDIDAEQEAWEAARACETAAWERQQRSTLPSRSVHL